MLQDRRDVAPAERRAQHRQAGLERGEPVGQRAVAEAAELADARHRGAHLVLAAAQREHPGLDEQQPRVAVHQRRPGSAGASRARTRAPGVGVVHPGLRRSAARPRRTRRPRRRAGSPRRSCRARGATRTRAGAAPATSPGSRRSSSTRRIWANRWWKRNHCRRSSSGRRKRFVRASDSSAPGRPVSSSTASHSSRAQPLEHRRAQHERLQLAARGPPSTSLGEEVDDVRARAVERLHERRAGPSLPGERQRREVDAGRPALGARDEQLDVGLRRARARAGR